MAVRTIQARLDEGLRATMTARTHTFTADEPEEAGGTDAAATPMELLMGSLASCTAITMRMYARRKAWALDGVDVRVEYSSTPTPTFVKHLTMHGALDDEQKARLLEIAERCPVAKLLRSGAGMEARLVDPAATP